MGSTIFFSVNQLPIMNRTNPKFRYKVNSMNRIKYAEGNQDALKPLFALGAYLKHCSIDEKLQELIKIRSSQLNGCAFCLDMHWKDARAMGETEQRLYGTAVWHESPYYTDRERAALAWTEAVTLCKVPDDVYAEVAKHFNPTEMVDLTMAINAINCWNRLNASFSKDNVGTYQPGLYK